MNHIYKVIWSRVKNSYVVVSEIAGTARKSGRVRVSKNTLAAVLAAFLLTGISVSPVSAALDGVNTLVEPGNQNIKIGNGTDLRNNSTKNGAIAIGDHAQIDDYVMQEGSVAIGKNAFVKTCGERRTKYSVSGCIRRILPVRTIYCRQGLPLGRILMPAAAV
ncbi:MAG: ESPR domain-containing protein [Dialister sp.]|uniref:ESPR domain-containing protein n=1 Tax=Dialister sp. TaxID=1955814 RepID=UPI001DC6855F|nr:ESPR domain-containing protein [Dialister sp.]MBS6715575.1 ESPR domain-containing protein [Dialister sp.]